MQALLVEDSPADSMLFGAYLEDAPFISHVHRAKRLSEALDALSARRFDLIILDLGLPDASGLEAFHAIRDHAPTSPVIVLTGLDDDALAQQAVHDGAQDFLLKPELDAAILARAARYAIERSRAQRELALMQSLTMALSTAESTGEALETALSLTGNASGWESGLAWMPVVGTGRWRLAASWSRLGAPPPSERTDADPFDPAGTFVKHVMDSESATWIADLSASDPDAFERVRGSLGMKAALGVPIRTKRETVAVLALFVRDVRAQDERLARLVGASLAPLGPVLARRRAEDTLSEYRLHLEDLVAERTAALETSMNQLRDADRLASIGTLAAGLGHDMRNILLPIRCRLDTVEAAIHTPDSRSAISEVRKWLSYLEEISSGLRDLALDPDAPPDEAESTDIRDWWEEVGLLLARGVPGSVGLDTKIDADLPMIRVARYKLTQAVLNLVVNAGEAMDDAGRITVIARRGEDAHSVRVSVRDDGPGMPPAIARRAADPFFTTKTRGLSTGMGLSLVRGVVNAC
ncbi:MAG: response regulator, partial [Planctomycetota bacterium]